ncbi:hypothetical protein [Spiroplasma tabanidicola]|uniref:Uncharacterized protein n=1 Tax=Spiroplasma tabanidicola TaxID=324079 RepID=A0A6I6CB13_9MOLU|nr:hypothetical protein [Spiroplasma tabanidicola]QGS52121.1 hypothetical protein STABA_v1c07650 [Spiroplasma tabanidicola]
MFIKFQEAFFDFINDIYNNFKYNYKTFLSSSKKIDKFFKKTKMILDLEKIDYICDFIIRNMKDFIVLNNVIEKETHIIVNKFYDVLTVAKLFWTNFINLTAFQRLNIEKTNLNESKQVSLLLNALFQISKNFSKSICLLYKEYNFDKIKDKDADYFYNIIKKNLYKFNEKTTIEKLKNLKNICVTFKDVVENDYTKKYQLHIIDNSNFQTIYDYLFTLYKRFYYITSFTIKFSLLLKSDNENKEYNQILSNYPFSLNVFEQHNRFIELDINKLMNN